MYIPIDAEPSNLTWQHGRGLVPRGGVPCSPILGFLYIYAYTFVTVLPNLTW